MTRKNGNPPGQNHRAGNYKFDDKRKGRYLDRLREGGRRHASARAVGVTPQTVALHMRSDAAFAEQVMWAEMEADDEVEDALRMAAISGNVTAALAWLYSRRPERWQDTRHHKVEMSGLVKEITEKCEALGIDPWSDAVLAAILVAAGATRGDGSQAQPDRGGAGAEAGGAGTGASE